MKFILNESNRLVLDERFILLETGTPVDSFPVADGQWKTPITNSITKLNDYKLTDITDAAKASASAADMADIFDETKVNGLANLKKRALDKLETNDLLQIVTAIRNYINKLKSLFSASKLPTNTKLNTFISDFTDMLNDIAANSGGWKIDKKRNVRTKTLPDNFNKLTTSVEAIINTSAFKDLDISSITPLIDKLSDNKKDALQTLDILKNATGDDLKILQTKETVAALSDLDTKLQPWATLTINRSVLSSNITVVADFLDKAIEVLTQFNATMEEESQYATDDAGHRKFADTVEKNKSKEDWAKLFSQIGNDKKASQQLWQQYFKIEWEENADKVQALGEAFITEVMKLGFDANVNPFIAFVKRALEIPLNINGNTYPAIHNSYVRDYIDVNALRSQPMGSIRPETNILFNKDLYNKPATDIVKYLSIQHQILELYEKDVTLASGKLTTAYGGSAGLDQKCNLVIALIFTEGLDILSVPDAATVDLNMQGKTLKSIAEITSLFKVCFGKEVLQDKKAINSVAYTDIWNALHKNSDELANAIKYLITRYDSATLKLKDIAKLYTEFKASGSGFDYTKAEQFRKIFDPYNIHPGNVAELINKLAETAGWHK